MDVRHGRLVALATLDPACMSMTSALRSRLTVGLPLRQDIKEDELYDKWIDQHAWSSFQAEREHLNGVCPPRERKLRELFAGAHAGQWLAIPVSSQLFHASPQVLT